MSEVTHRTAGATPAGPLFWSTDDVPPAERLSYWVDAVCEAFFELRVDSKAGSGFQGSAHLQTLGPLGMIFMHLGDQHIERTPSQISRSRSSQFQLIQYRNMPGLVTQFGREAWVEPGGMTLVDSRHPFTIDNAAGLDALSIALPADWLEQWVPAAHDVVARVLPRGVGWGGTLGAVLERLRPDADGGTALPGSVAAEQIGALLALAMGERGGTADSGPLDRSLAYSIRDTIRGFCQDGSLTPEAVASEHAISLRRLHYELAAHGTSFMAELHGCRLDGAARMLADRRFAGLTVVEVARRWSFASGSHFARLFRGRFGASPAVYRSTLHG